MPGAGLGAAAARVHPQLGGQAGGEGEPSGGHRRRHHRAPDTGTPATWSKGTFGLTSFARSTGWPERTRAAITSVTSQTLTFMPASTRPSCNQKATYSPVAGSPRKATSS